MVQRLAAHDAVTLWAPWANDGIAAQLPRRLQQLVPARIGGFLRRRQLPLMPAFNGRVVTDPRWLAVQGVMRMWTHNSRARELRAGLFERRMLAAWTCRRLQRSSAEATMLVATSLAAREPFALAKALGMRTVLFLDLPHLATLHADLDRAAQRWPTDQYLRHFRAPAWTIARQHAEFELADHIIVRGPYAASSVATRTRRRLTDIEVLPTPAIGPVIELATSPDAPLLLAGPAAGRNGFTLAADAAAQLGRTLLVRSSAATDPRHRAAPGVRWLDHDAPLPRTVAAIVAPAVCEAFLPCTPGAGLHVVGSDKVSGVTDVVDLTVDSLVNAVMSALRQ